MCTELKEAGWESNPSLILISRKLFILINARIAEYAESSAFGYAAVTRYLSFAATYRAGFPCREGTPRRVLPCPRMHSVFLNKNASGRRTSKPDSRAERATP
jgi:hypothetical protein